jgi:transcriptional regulator with XRE-family HTH domain
MKVDLTKDLGSLIKEYREKREYSIDILAVALDVSKEYLRQIETGKIKNPSVFTVLRLADLLQIPIERIQNISRLQVKDDILGEELIKATSLHVLKQEIILKLLDDNGIVEKIQFTQRVLNPSPRKLFEKKFHALHATSAILDSIKIHAKDNKGNSLRIEEHERKSNRIEFYVYFNKPLSMYDGEYEYFWWVEGVPYFQKEFEEFKDHQTLNLDSPHFWWRYEPVTEIGEFKIEVINPQNLRIANYRFVSLEDDDHPIGKYAKFEKDGREVIQIIAGRSVNNEPLLPGTYRLSWWYQSRKVNKHLTRKEIVGKEGGEIL